MTHPIIIEILARVLSRSKPIFDKLKRENQIRFYCIGDMKTTFQESLIIGILEAYPNFLHPHGFIQDGQRYALIKFLKGPMPTCKNCVSDVEDEEDLEGSACQHILISGDYVEWSPEEWRYNDIDFKEV